MKAAVARDHAGVVGGVRLVGQREAAAEHVRRVERDVEHHAFRVLADHPHTMAQVLFHVVRNTRDRNHLVRQRARQQAQPLWLEDALVEHVGVGRSRQLRREQLADLRAYELTRSRLLRRSQILVQRLARIEAENANHVQAGRRPQGLEGRVQREPHAALRVDQRPAVVRVRQVRFDPHAMNADRARTARARDPLVRNPCPLQDAHRLLDVGRARQRNQRGRAQLDHSAHDIARGCPWRAASRPARRRCRHRSRCARGTPRRALHHARGRTPAGISLRTHSYTSIGPRAPCGRSHATRPGTFPPTGASSVSTASEPSGAMAAAAAARLTCGAARAETR